MLVYEFTVKEQNRNLDTLTREEERGITFKLLARREMVWQGVIHHRRRHVSRPGQDKPHHHGGQTQLHKRISEFPSKLQCQVCFPPPGGLLVWGGYQIAKRAPGKRDNLPLYRMEGGRTQTRPSYEWCWTRPPSCLSAWRRPLTLSRAQGQQEPQPSLFSIKLLQKKEENGGRLVPVDHASRTLSTAEERWNS